MIAIPLSRWSAGSNALPLAMVDIIQYPAVIDAINAIVNNGGAAEIKLEGRKGEAQLVVVELSRQVKNKTSVGKERAQGRAEGRA